MNNCSNHGNCNSTSSMCTCVGGWTGSDCSSNVHVAELLKIKETTRIIGTLFVFIVPIALTASSYLMSASYFGGYFFLIIEIMQFIGLTSLIGTNSTPLYLKFSTFFTWSNFLFSTTEGSSISIIYNEVMPKGAYEEERYLMMQSIGISFIDNFVLVTTSILITLMLCVFIILVKVIRGKYTDYDNKEIEKMKDRIYTSMIRMALLIYSGLSLSTLFQIKMTLISVAPLVTLFTSLSILIGFVWGWPFLVSVVLKSHQVKIASEDNNSQLPIAPLYNDFRPGTYQFLLIVLVKKLVFMFVIGFFEGIELLIALLCAQAIYFLIVLIVRPYREVGRVSRRIIEV